MASNAITNYVTFVDFEKAFDSVHKESFWEIMASYGIPHKIIRMVHILYQVNECAVLDEGEQSEWFKVKTGVKQGDIMSGFIFLMVVDWIMRKQLKKATQASDEDSCQHVRTWTSQMTLR